MLNVDLKTGISFLHCIYLVYISFRFVPFRSDDYQKPPPAYGKHRNKTERVSLLLVWTKIVYYRVQAFQLHTSTTHNVVRAQITDAQIKNIYIKNLKKIKLKFRYKATCIRESYGPSRKF